MNTASFQRTLERIENHVGPMNGAYTLAAALSGDRAALVNLIVWHAKQAGVFSTDEGMQIGAWWHDEASTGSIDGSDEFRRLISERDNDSTCHHLFMARKLISAWSIHYEAAVA